MNGNKIIIRVYSIDDTNLENISHAMEYTIFTMKDVDGKMFAKTSYGGRTEILTPIEVYELLGATGTIDEVKAKIVKLWEDKNYIVVVVDEDGNIID